MVKVPTASKKYTLDDISLMDASLPKKLPIPNNKTAKIPSKTHLSMIFSSIGT